LAKLIRTSTVAVSLDYLLKGQLAFLKKSYEVLAVSGQDKHLEAVGNREGVKTIAVEMQRNISLLKDLKSLWQLYWLFKKEKPLIVHSITPKAGLLSMAAAYFAKVPIRMHTFTGLIFPTRKGFMQLLLIAMDKLLCKFATNIYPEGKGVKNDLISYNITNKPLKILANGNVNGINTSYFNPQLVTQTQNKTLRQQLNIGSEDFVFIFVGRLVGDKGINELVNAFKKLQNQNDLTKKSEARQQDRTTAKQQNSTTARPHDFKTARLLLVGPLETELDPLLPETLEEIASNKNIISVGWQIDVRPYFAISNALVFPSYREGFPNVVMQAGAMGLPSIVTNINGCNEIIVDGKNGIIIPVKDSITIYTAMKKMAENANYFKQLQQNARQMIVSRYKQQLVWDAILAEYNNLEALLDKKC